MSYDWDDAASLLLIEKFHENEILWSPSHPNYKNRTKRCEVLKKIAKYFGSGVDSNEIERKWKNLTSHYYREKKKFEMSGAEGDETREPKWFAYKALEFLRNKNRAAQTQKNDTGSLTETQSSASGRSRKRKRNSHDDNTERPTRELRDVTGSVRDDATVFGEYIATKIRRMDDITTSTVQHLIQNIIYQAEMGVYSQITSASAFAPAYFAASLRHSSSQSDCSSNEAVKSEP